MIERLDEIWRAPAAPRGLANAVLDRVERRRRGRAAAVAAIAAALAAALILLLWSPAPGVVDIEHAAGYAVYRAATPVTVRTPAGAVHARSADFSVEVTSMKRELVSAAAGAAVAVAVVVVYRGAVTARGERGEVTVEAGERLELGGSGAVGPASEVPPPPASATREQLLVRDRMLVQRIATLSSRVSELEGKLAAAGSASAESGPDPDKFLDLSESELAILADRCELRYDIPGYAMTDDVGAIMERVGRTPGLADAERAAIEKAMRAGDPELVATLRAIYIEVTGDRAGAESLSLRNIQHEVFEKSAPGDVAEALRLISAERAGRAEPPADLASRPPVERMLRALAASGAALERALAAELGPERARQLRDDKVVWARRRQSGCPD